MPPQYTIVSQPTPADFLTETTLLINAGWAPVGGVSVDESIAVSEQGGQVRVDLFSQAFSKGFPTPASPGFGKVSITSLDTTMDFLDPKVTPGFAILTTVLNPGLSETLEIAVNPGAININTLTGTLAIIKGGTGAITALLAFNNLSPLTTAGDTLYHNGVNNVRLPIGTAGQQLTVVAGLPAWSSATPGAADYVNSHDTTTQTVAVANTFQDVTFDTNDQLNGWTHTVGTALFTCPTTAIYRVEVRAFVDKTSGASSIAELRTLFNGVEVPSSQQGVEIASNNTTLETTNTFLVSATATQILKVQFTGGSTTTRIAALGGNATTKPSVSITISKI